MIWLAAASSSTMMRSSRTRSDPYMTMTGMATARPIAAETSASIAASMRSTRVTSAWELTRSTAFTNPMTVPRSPRSGAICPMIASAARRRSRRLISARPCASTASCKASADASRWRMAVATTFATGTAVSSQIASASSTFPLPRTFTTPFTKSCQSICTRRSSMKRSKKMTMAAMASATSSQKTGPPESVIGIFLSA